MAHRLRVSAMSLVMPSQNSEDSARAVIPLMPWWAACRALRQAGRRSVGTMILSPRHMTPSMMDRSCTYGHHSRMEVGMSRFDVGGPLSMSDVSSCRVGSDAVAICRDSQSSGMPVTAAHMA